MTDATEGPTRGRARVLGAAGAAVGVAVVLSSYVLAGGDSFGLLTGMVAGTAVVCLVTLRLPQWRPAGVGLLVGMAGTHLGLLALLVMWIAGLGPA